MARLVFSWSDDCHHARSKLLRGGKLPTVNPLMPAPGPYSAQYDAYFVNGAGHIIGVEPIVSSSEYDALKSAHQRLLTHAKCLCIELWNEQRCIAVIERD